MPVKVVSVPRREARAYLAKAQQFAAEARSALAAERHDAALLNAVHGAISAADAVAVAIGGRRSADPDDLRVADLIEELARDRSELAGSLRQLRTLLKKKHIVAYEARATTAKEAAEGVERAERFIAWAAEVVGTGAP